MSKSKLTTKEKPVFEVVMATVCSFLQNVNKKLYLSDRQQERCQKADEKSPLAASTGQPVSRGSTLY